jgi:hypothetical protein
VRGLEWRVGVCTEAAAVNGITAFLALLTITTMKQILREIEAFIFMPAFTEDLHQPSCCTLFLSTSIVCF